MAQTNLPPLGYDPEALPREKTRHYIPVDDQDIKAMQDKIGVVGFADLFRHLPKAVRFAEAPELPEELSYEDLQVTLFELSKKNKTVQNCSQTV